MSVELSATLTRRAVRTKPVRAVRRPRRARPSPRCARRPPARRPRRAAPRPLHALQRRGDLGFLDEPQHRRLREVDPECFGDRRPSVESRCGWRSRYHEPVVLREAPGGARGFRPDRCRAAASPCSRGPTPSAPKRAAAQVARRQVRSRASRRRRRARPSGGSRRPRRAVAGEEHDRETDSDETAPREAPRSAARAAAGAGDQHHHAPRRRVRRGRRGRVCAPDRGLRARRQHVAPVGSVPPVGVSTASSWAAAPRPSASGRPAASRGSASPATPAPAARSAGAA